MENILESKLSVNETVKLMSNTANDNLVCPITLEPIHDPVVADDGHIYEREASVQWIIQNETSPLTREPLNLHNLYSNENIRRDVGSRHHSIVINQTETNAVNVPTVTRVSPNLQRQTTLICSSHSPVFDQANDANGQRCSNKWHKGKYGMMIITFLCIILIVIPTIRGLYGSPSGLSFPGETVKKIQTLL